MDILRTGLTMSTSALRCEALSEGPAERGQGLGGSERSGDPPTFFDKSIASESKTAFFKHFLF